METTFTVSVDQAKDWIASFLRFRPSNLPPWLSTAFTFVSQLKGKKLEITVRVVDD